MEQEVLFQQDGIPPHYYEAVKEYLDHTYLGRWIDWRRSVNWPARSPDLTPFNCFL